MSNTPTGYSMPCFISRPYTPRKKINRIHYSKPTAQPGNKSVSLKPKTTTACDNETTTQPKTITPSGNESATPQLKTTAPPGNESATQPKTTTPPGNESGTPQLKTTAPPGNESVTQPKTTAPPGNESATPQLKITAPTGNESAIQPKSTDTPGKEIISRKYYSETTYIYQSRDKCRLALLEDDSDLESMPGDYTLTDKINTPGFEVKEPPRIMDQTISKFN
jgi:hypothetical protein